MLAGICLNTIHVGASSKMSTTLVTLSDVLIFFVCLPQKSEEFYNLFGYRKSKLTFQNIKKKVFELLHNTPLCKTRNKLVTTTYILTFPWGEKSQDF